MGFGVVATRIDTDSLCRDGCCMKPDQVEKESPLECKKGCCPEEKIEPTRKPVAAFEKGCCSADESQHTEQTGIVSMDENKKLSRWILKVDELETQEDANIVLILLRRIDSVVHAEVDLAKKIYTVLTVESVSEESLLDPFHTMGFDVDVKESTIVDPDYKENSNSRTDDIEEGTCSTGSCPDYVKEVSCEASCCASANITTKTPNEEGACNTGCCAADVKEVACGTGCCASDNITTVNSNDDGPCNTGCCTAAVTEVSGETKNSNVDYSEVYIGNKSMATRLGWTDKFGAYLAICDEWETRGFSYCIFGYSDEPIAAFCIGDEIRDEAKEAITKLHELGIEVTMLTGDNAGSAKNVSEIVGIDKFYAGLRPEGKRLHLAELERKVAMVGDGINDALSLASADVSVAMGCMGSAIAIETADVALMEDNLLRLEKAVRLGRVCLRKIKQNVIFSIAFKVAIVAVTFGVPFPNLWLAISADVGAMLLVTLNSMSVLGRKKSSFRGKAKLKKCLESKHIRAEECHVETIV
uniref:HMA domain-containing protein n=1 Tax=Aplanochytrium stocchinoi TaxID=215587 RepID=A0A7S3LPS5_9STRA